MYGPCEPLADRQTDRQTDRQMLQLVAFVMHGSDWEHA